MNIQRVKELPSPLRCLIVASMVLCLGARGGQAQPFRVCTFSFNSPAELNALSAQLPESRFEIIDLSPPHMIGEDGEPLQESIPQGHGPPQWLTESCREDLECDMVVISGEFAGRFFGKYGASLSLQELEEASCMPRCRGLFHYPQEVFLLACNTLATKAEDSRTPAQYLQVLLDHGFDLPSAERVVNLRYGPLGPSFREALRRTFMGVPRLYGFSSVGPRGEVSAAMLTGYFKNKGDYSRFLRSAEESRAPNRELLSHFRSTSLVQSSGLTETEPAAGDRALVCALYDPKRPVADRLRIVRQILERKDPLAFLPIIQVFFSRNPTSEFSPEEQDLFASIQKQSAAREQLLKVVYDLEVSALQMELAHLGYQLGWIKASEFRRLAVTGVRELISEPLSNEVVDIMCQIGKHENVGGSFQSEDLPEKLFRNAIGVRFIECLHPVDDRINFRLAAALDSSDELTRLWAIHTLTRRRPVDNVVLHMVGEHRDDPSADMRNRVKFLLEHPQLPEPAATPGPSASTQAQVN